MRPNQLRVILIFLITPTTTWLIARYPYTTETQRVARILNKKFFFQLDALYPHGMNERILFH